MKRQAQYQGLKKSAEAIRRRGQDGDSVLAHINPEEAQYLEQNFGGDVNPYTGLPQFGLFSGIGKVFRGVEKAVRRPVKMLAPIVGSAIGGMLGGPAGAVAGGSLGGALKSRHNMLNNAFQGGLMGLGHSIVSPMIGRGLGLDPNSMLGRGSMMNAPSWGETLGFGGSGAGATGISRFFGGSNQSANPQEGGNQESGGQGGGLGGLGGMDLLNTALLGTGIAGTLLGRNRTPAYGTPENESMQQAMQRNRPVWGPEHAYRGPEQMNREPKSPPKGYRKTKWKFFPTPEEQQAQLLEAQQEMAEPGYERRYAKGGHVRGYYDGGDSGQSDKIPVDLPEDAYIMDATTISLSGDGNSVHGAKQTRKLLDSFAKNGISRDEGDSKNVKALVSDGEMYVSPKEVKAVGGGSIKKGVKKLDKFRNNLRQHKGVKKFLPPKSKPLVQYLR